MKVFAFTSLPLVTWLLWSPVSWESSSFGRANGRSVEDGPISEPMEEREARRSCIRAFFLLSWRVGPRAGEEVQVSAPDDVLLRLPEVPAGTLKRLSQDGHVATPSSRRDLPPWAPRPDIVQKSRILPLSALLSSNLTSRKKRPMRRR